MFVIRERHYAHSVYLYTVAMLGFFDARASKWPPLKGITIFIKSHLVIAYPVACVNSLKFAERRKPKLFSATIHFSALRPLLPGQVAPYSPHELHSCLCVCNNNVLDRFKVQQNIRINRAFDHPSYLSSFSRRHTIIKRTIQCHNTSTNMLQQSV